MHGVNPQTVWTWNAIGKRRGAWGLDADAPESNQGFLLNHVISELLPQREGGHRYSNSDPVTGQAAWYDLRVRLERCLPEEAGETAPLMPPVKAPPPRGLAAGGLFCSGDDLKSPSPAPPDRGSPSMDGVRHHPTGSH